MKHDDMMDLLWATDPASRLPLWVISYRRAGTAPFLNTVSSWRTAGDVNVVVRESEADAYRAAYPRLNICPLPDAEIGNCGSARWGAADLAYMLGQDRILMADDDVLAINFLYEGAIKSGPNAGKESSARSGKAEREVMPDLEERVLAAASAVSMDVMDAHPNALTGGFIKQHMAFSEKNHRARYVLNGGVTPRQLWFWNLGRMHEMGVRLNLDLFGVHGEDIGLAAEVLKAGGDCWSLPSFTYDHWPESVNIHKSSIRNPENAARLHAEEWAALQHYPIVNYIKVKGSIIDGSYEWGDVDWRKLHKLRGTAPVRVEWEELI